MGIPSINLGLGIGMPLMVVGLGMSGILGLGAEIADWYLGAGTGIPSMISGVGADAMLETGYTKSDEKDEIAEAKS